MIDIKMTSARAVLGFVLPFAVVLTMVLSGIDIFIALIAALAVLVIYGMILGAKLKDMEKAMANGASAVIGAVLVVILVGGLIGVWMACGSVPAMLYYGIKLINPQMFLPLAFIICSITSLATGACWGTAATVGVALIGVAAGIGVPLPLAAGAIISGSHFGDKLSPLSDTTLLASATARADLYDHIVSMLYDTIPVTVICLVAYSILGAGYGNGASNLSEITAITDGIQAEFRINLWMLVPPMVTIFMAVKRVPSIIVFGFNIFFGILWAMLFQGVGFAEMCKVAFYGYVSSSPVESVSSLLSRSGAASMATTIYVSLFSGMFAGLLQNMNILPTLMGLATRHIKSSKGLITMTSATCILLMVGGGGQYTTLTLPGTAFHDTYEKYDIKPCVLSRIMENSGTLIGSIIPWDVSGIFLASTLGVPTLVYFPFALLPLLSPFIDIINGWLGFGVFHSNEPVRLTLKRRKDN